MIDMPGVVRSEIAKMHRSALLDREPPIPGTKPASPRYSLILKPPFQTATAIYVHRFQARISDPYFISTFFLLQKLLCNN